MPLYKTTFRGTGLQLVLSIPQVVTFTAWFACKYEWENGNDVSDGPMILQSPLSFTGRVQIWDMSCGVVPAFEFATCLG